MQFFLPQPDSFQSVREKTLKTWSKKGEKPKYTINTMNSGAAFEKTNLALHLSDINLDNGNDSRMNRGGSDLVSLSLFLSLTAILYLCNQFVKLLIARMVSKKYAG